MGRADTIELLVGVGVESRLFESSGLRSFISKSGTPIQRAPWRYRAGAVDNPATDAKCGMPCSLCPLGVSDARRI